MALRPGVFGKETEFSLDADAGGWRCSQSPKTKVAGNECLLLMVVMVVGGAAVSGFASGAKGRRSWGIAVRLRVGLEPGASELSLRGSQPEPGAKWARAVVWPDPIACDYWD